VAERRGYVRFRSEQPPYSLIVRGIENSVLPTCDRYGMGVLTWSPLAAGWLSGKYQKERATDMTTARARLVPQRFDLSLPDNVRKLEVVDGLAGVAREAGLSLTHMAVAFVLAHPTVTAAIIGREQWTTCRACSRARRSSWTTPLWTASTNWCLRGRTSTRRIPAGRRPLWPIRRCDGAPGGTQRRLAPGRRRERGWRRLTRNGKNRLVKATGAARRRPGELMEEVRTC